jgi:Tfp pilus assembly protein PilV
MIAMLVLTVGVVATMGVFGVAVQQNSSQGEYATRTTEYAQDKMEQLISLNFNDSTTNTTVYPPGSNGTGLGGAMAGSTTVGGTNTSSPVSGYVDYLTMGGALQTSATGAFYVRQWSITTDSTGNMKTVTVLTKALVTSKSSSGVAPSTILVCTKANY